MKVGSQITVRAYDLSGRLARVWPVTVERVIDGGVVVYSQAGTRVEGAKGGWNSLKDTRTYYWLDRGFNLIELYEPGGTYDGIYIHIASPPRIDEGGIAYTDYELDIVQSAGGCPRLVDVDEFHEAVERHGLSAEFQAACFRSVAEAFQVLAGWTGHAGHELRSEGS